MSELNMVIIYLHLLHASYTEFDISSSQVQIVTNGILFLSMNILYISKQSQIKKNLKKKFR